MSQHSPIPKETIEAIKSLGFKVYQSPDPDWRTYLFFTDGDRIGYLQKGDGGELSISTVHKPNRQTGSSFGMGDLSGITREGLEVAFRHAPGWAYSVDRAATHKWPTVEAFLSKSFNNLQEV